MEARWHVLESIRIINTDSEPLYSTISRARYLSCCSISNAYPHRMRMWENLAKLVCRASMLKFDSCRLKSLTPTNWMWSRSDNCAVEGVFHLVMQCLGFEVQRAGMYRVLNNVRPMISEQIPLHSHNINYPCENGIWQDVFEKPAGRHFEIPLLLRYAQQRLPWHYRMYYTYIAVLTINVVKSIVRIPTQDYYWAPNKAMLEAQFHPVQQINWLITC